jgi:hypothetical protein
MNRPSDEQRIIIQHVKMGKNVIVDACAGSGKSTTILSCAQEMPDTTFLQITYNASLRKEVREKIRELQLKNIQVHTYHSLAVATYDKQAHTDTGIRHLLHQNTPPMSPIKPKEIVVLDECQDMTLLYFQLIIKYVKDMGTKIQVMVLGDYMQGLYEFKGADIRFLTHAQEIWQKCACLKTGEFAQCTLQMSYRITQPMADFVNHVMLGEQRLLACKPGEPVIYMRNSMHNLERQVVFQIRQLIQQGINPSEIFVLAGSIKGANSQIRKIENVLVQAEIPCHVPMFETDKIDEKVMNGKVVFSTFHCVKGRQRAYVFVVGFDQSYLEYYARTEDKTVCPNTLYVATTRATHKLYLLETDHYPEDRPLTFLKMSHHEMKQVPYIDFKGTPKTIFVEKEEKQGTEEEIKTHYVTPTDLIKFIPEHVLEEIAPILDDIFIRETTEEEERELDIPNMIKTNLGFYEEVSDLNGIAIPAMYYDFIRSYHQTDADNDADQANPANILYEIIQEAIENMKPNHHLYLRQIVANLSPVCESIEDYLYMANVYVASQEKLYFKLKQIQQDEYGWLSQQVLAKCKKRIIQVLDEECKHSCTEIEKTVLQKFDDNTHENIDACLFRYFPTDQFRFTARVDLMTDQTLWEIKCCSVISMDHLLQVVIYAWIMRTLDPGFSKKVKIFNIKTGEIRRLEAEKSLLDKIMIALLKGKYGKQKRLETETFIEDCHANLS